ncbi:hypothetical protein LDENG_00212850 [Lucifuga dentata]|nr:hypothetical protein LDENG_00212850 [Lucifuga dentata]
MPAEGVYRNFMQTHHGSDSYETIDNPESFLKQDYEQLKQYCVKKRFRYIDDMFPPDRDTIGQGILNPFEMDHVEWLRPGVHVFVCL